MPNKAIKLACGIAVAMGTMNAPAWAATITIKVGASQSLANSLVDIIGAFQSYYFDAGLSYNVAVTVDANQNLKSAVAGGSSAASYDLVLTDDSEVSHALATGHSAYVEGQPFTFAYDRLDLYSVTVDVSQYVAGLPPRFAGPVVIPDPASDAYGRQAAKLLGDVPWFIQTIPSARVKVQPDVATVRASVEMGVHPYGILAKSSICTHPSGTEVYPEGSSHHTYPPLAGARYQRIALTGIKTASPSRTPDQATELAQFVDFLKGVGTTLGTDVLKRSCYSLPQ